MNRYRPIEEWVTTQIRQGDLRIGDKLPSESELCTRFGVSRHTVRLAMSNLAAAGWTETRKGIGTFCAMRDRRLTHDIGLVCYFTGSYIFPRISRGCDQIAHRNGFHLLLNQSEYDLAKEREIILRLRKRGVDGIIIEPVYDGESPSNADLLEEVGVALGREARAEDVAVLLKFVYFSGPGIQGSEMLRNADQERCRMGNICRSILKNHKEICFFRENFHYLPLLG